MRKLAFALVLAAFSALGCRAQIPAATPHVVNLTIQAPAASGNWAGCTTANPCTFAIYRAPASNGVCPIATSSAYSEVTNPASRPSGTSYTDQGAAGLIVCYGGETVQGGSNSGPSNIVGPVTVPGTPLAPSLGAPTVAQNVLPDAPIPQPTNELTALLAPKLKVTVR